MSYKWNERLVMNFLKVYKQHPCLWNPYHKDYYNCYEKNEALKKIIDNLGTPGFTVTDYLHQIKAIREKYKQEQTRTIKSLQSQKLYRSPFPWYNIVADMLTKVIDDEEKVKQQNTYSILKSLSSDNVRYQRMEKTGTRARLLKVQPYNNATCDQKFRRSKSVEKAARLSGKVSSMDKHSTKEKIDKKVRYALCPQYRPSESRSRDRSKDRDFSCRPTKDTDLDVNVFPTSVVRSSTNARHNYPCSLSRRNSESNRTAFLQCPVCGWEKTTINKAKKIKESNINSCCRCTKDVNDITYVWCAGCNNVTRDDQSYPLQENMNNSGDFGFLQNPTKQSDMVSSKSKIDSREAAKKFVDAEVQYSEVSLEISKNNDTDLELGAGLTQDDPVIVNKLKCGAIEACTQLKIILSSLNKNLKTGKVLMENVSKDTRLIESAEAECLEKNKHASVSAICPEIKKIDVGVNTVTSVEKGVQNVIEIPGIRENCTAPVQTLNRIQQNGVKEDKRPRKCLTKSRQVSLNIVDQVSKETQSKVCVSRGCLCCSLPLGKAVDVETATSIHEIRNVGCATTENVKEFQTKCVQCTVDDKLLLANRGKCCRSIKCNVEDSIFDQPAETEAHEFQCPYMTDACSLNILNALKDNCTVVALLQKLLQSLLIKNVQTAQNATLGTETNHEGKPNGSSSIDTTKLMNSDKEYTSKPMQLNVPNDNNNLKEVCERFRDEVSPRKVEEKQNSTDTDITISYDSKLNMTEESTFQPLFQSSDIKEDNREGIIQDVDLPKEHSSKRLPTSVKDAGISSKHRDCDSNVSMFQVKDIGTQSCAQLMKDCVCLANYEQEKPERISIGTQKRDPILVRLIKCTGSQAVVRSDKETLTVGSNVDKEKKCTDKRVEACCRQTCISPGRCRKLKEAYLDKAWRTRYEDKTTDNCCRRFISFQNDICDKNCRENLSYDWTDVRNYNAISNPTVSKIPLCAKSWKNVLAKNK